MTARIIDGKALAREEEAQARARSEALASRPGGRRPGLAVVLVGEDPASCVYVKNKTRACEGGGQKKRKKSFHKRYFKLG